MGVLGGRRSGLASGSWEWLGIWRHAPRDTPPADMPLKGAFLATLANKQFLYFLPTFVLYQLSTTMTLGWMPFFVKAILGAENEGSMSVRADGHGARGDDGGGVRDVEVKPHQGQAMGLLVMPAGHRGHPAVHVLRGPCAGSPHSCAGDCDRVSCRAAHGRRQPHAARHHCRHHRLRRDPHRHAPRGDVLRESEPLREDWFVLLSAAPIAHPAAWRDCG